MLVSLLRGSASAWRLTWHFCMCVLFVSKDSAEHLAAQINHVSCFNAFLSLKETLSKDNIYLYLTFLHWIHLSRVFFKLEVILGHQNSTKPFLWFTSAWYAMISLLNLLKLQNHEGYLMLFIENQNIVFLATKWRLLSNYIINQNVSLYPRQQSLKLWLWDLYM